jgi:catechol 2,3-dioxygenase
MLIQRIAHAAIRVHDLDAALDFYGRVLGLAEVGRGNDGRVFLAGGRTSGYELALIPGGAGLEHFAFQVGSTADLDEAAERLRAAGTEVTEAPAGEETRIERGIRFALPSGHLMELVLPAGATAFTQPGSIGPQHFGGVGPLNIDHVTMLAPSVEPVVEFLTRHLGFRLSESVQPEPGFWLNAFLRSRDQHHDIAFFAGDGAQLNHVAFRINGLDDIRRACDLVAELGYRVDASPGRHEQGNNLFVYFKDPAGNRVELSGDMASIDAAAPPRILRESRFDTWRPGLAPEVLAGT